MRHEGCRVLGRSPDLQYYRQPEENKSVRSKERTVAGLISLLHWSRQDTVKENIYIARDESVTLCEPLPSCQVGFLDARMAPGSGCA
jgi:hypothetical protein